MNWEILTQNWAELMLASMALIKVVVRLTPSVKDDAVFGWLDKLVEYFVPNLGAKK